MSFQSVPCATAPEIFQHPLVEDPATTTSDPLLLRELVDRAGRLCNSCPLADRCLYDAVVEHDVAGIAAGTTAAQRSRIRRLLGVRVAPQDLGEFSGTTREGSRLNPAEVLRLRRSDPDASLEMIAERLGCSLSTVKRHLRRARKTAGIAPVPAPRPTLDAVLSTAAMVAGRRQTTRVA